MNINYWLLLPSAAFGLIALAFALAAKYNAGLYEQANKNFTTLLQSRDEARLQRDKLNRENAELVALNADMHDALEDAHKEIKALNMRTSEMPDIATQPPIPARPKPRRSVQKAGGE